MPVLIGQVVLTAELLNKIVKPFILSGQSILHRMDFRLEKGKVTFHARGKHLLQFRAAGSVDLIRFSFGPGGHNVTLAVHLKLYPRYLTLFARNPLEKVFVSQPGFHFRGNILEVELRKIPWLAAVNNIQIAGADLFSLLEITSAGNSDQGLLFDIALAEEEMNFDQGPKGISLTEGETNGGKTVGSA